MIYIFILAIFTGVEVISRVPTVLHTPLMSGANAIHGIVLIGGVILLGMAGDNDALFALGFIAVDLRDLECGRRLCRDRPDVGNVQSQNAQQTRRRQMNRDTVPSSRLSDRVAALHLWTQAAELAAHGAVGQFRRRRWHGAGAARHVSVAGHGPLRLPSSSPSSSAPFPAGCWPSVSR